MIMNGVKDLPSKRSSSSSSSCVSSSSADQTRKTLDVHHAALMKNLGVMSADIDKHKAKMQELRDEINASRGVVDCSAPCAQLFSLSNQVVQMQRDFDFLNNNAQTADIMFRYFSALSPSTKAYADGSANNANANQVHQVQQHHPETSILRFFTSSSSASSEAPSPKTTTTSCEPHGNNRNVMDKSKMLQDYMHIACNKTPLNVVVVPETSDYSAAPATNVAAGMSSDKCSFCGSSDVSVHPHEGLGTCNECGTTEFIVVDSDKPSFKDQPKEIHYWSYKRVNHLNECLNQMQGKETTEISDSLMERIMAEIKKRRITDVSKVSMTMLRAILKKLNESKYYEHLPSLLQRLNGTKLPYLPPELERRIKQMFAQMQAPYIKFAPKGRTNFMSYNFCVYKCLQLLGHDEYLEQNNCHFIKLLKSHEKISEQDKVWSKICVELGWTVIRSR